VVDDGRPLRDAPRERGIHRVARDDLDPLADRHLGTAYDPHRVSASCERAGELTSDLACAENDMKHGNLLMQPS
jgi:hypothetical protein